MWLSVVRPDRGCVSDDGGVKSRSFRPKATHATSPIAAVSFGDQGACCVQGPAVIVKMSAGLAVLVVGPLGSVVNAGLACLKPSRRACTHA